jgi:hypothetical protein
MSRGGERDFEKLKVVQAINKKLTGLLTGKGEVFYNCGKNKKVNPMLMCAIAMHETAGGTSKVLRECNNVGGINWTSKADKRKGRYKVYDSIDDSINHLAYILSEYYIKKGRTSIEAIGAIYCPLNDPDNGKWGMSNESWVPSVTNTYQQILKEAIV